MSDTGELFREMHEASKAKRAKNREQSYDLLVAEGLPFESKNGGAHLIVQSSFGIVDFWPGTGKWIARSGQKGRGVKGLISRHQKDAG